MKHIYIYIKYELIDFRNQFLAHHTLIVIIIYIIFNII